MIYVEDSWLMKSANFFFRSYDEKLPSLVTVTVCLLLVLFWSGNLWKKCNLFCRPFECYMRKVERFDRRLRCCVLGIGLLDQNFELRSYTKICNHGSCFTNLGFICYLRFETGKCKRLSGWTADHDWWMWCVFVSLVLFCEEMSSWLWNAGVL